MKAEGGTKTVMPRLLIVLLSIALAACAGGFTIAPPPEIPEAPEVSEPTDVAEAVVVLSPANQLNAPFLEGSVTDVVHGAEVADPWRSLEDDSDATWAWVDAQTALTRDYMAGNARSERSERIEELLSIGYFGDTAQAGGLLFYTKRDGDAEQAILWVVSPLAEPRVLVNPNLQGERVAIDWFYPSPQGTYVAYGLSENGDERSTLHILEVATGDHMAEQIPHTKWTSLAWLGDESGFYYTRFPAPGEPDYDAENEDAYSAHLFFHALGRAPERDRLVFEAPEPTYFLGPEVSDDDRWLLVQVWRSWSASDLYLIDREQPNADPVTITEGGDALVYGDIFDGRLIMHSNEAHPMGRLLEVPVEMAADATAWDELVPEAEGSIDGVAYTENHLVVAYVEDVTSVIRIFDAVGLPLGEVPLPDRGSVGALATDPENGDTLFFTFNSFFHPPAVYGVDVPDGDVTRRFGVGADIDPSGYRLTRETVRSSDGTDVPVHIVHRRDAVLDGSNPVLVNGYGGFNVSMTPGFQRNVLYWLEQGGVFVQASIRGGGEFGEAWHRDGMLGNKQNVFDDFEAVIRWLSSSGWSAPNRIAITGGSNGGLLMGAMLTQCPDAFAAAVSSVGLYDMVRFTEFPPAEIWMGEYGDPSIEQEFEWLHAYSPYHHVAEGTEYPATLILTADSDTRVSWQHSTKFAAALQWNTGADRPILFHMERDSGHGAGTSRSSIVEEYVDRYTFIETQLGVH